jgi:hypothetical protein
MWRKDQDMHLKRRFAAVGEAVPDRNGSTVKPLSAGTTRIISLRQRGPAADVISPEDDGNSRVTAVLQEMVEQVRELVATVDSLRAQMK